MCFQSKKPYPLPTTTTITTTTTTVITTVLCFFYKTYVSLLCVSVNVHVYVARGNGGKWDPLPQAMRATSPAATQPGCTTGESADPSDYSPLELYLHGSVFLFLTLSLFSFPRCQYEGLSRKKAEELLLLPNNQTGSFLVRESQTRPGEFSSQSNANKNRESSLKL